MVPDQLVKILKDAVDMEEESYNLYTNAQRKARLASSRNFLKELADTELEHKKKLNEAISNEAQIQSLGSQKDELLEDLKISDYLKDVGKLSKDADYQEILTYAAKKEKKAHDFYASLAEKCKRTQMGELFQRLAQEELKHKIKIEKEYDDNILREN